MAGRPRKELSKSAKHYEFAVRFAALMKKSRFPTQSSLGEKLGTTSGEIGHWVKGERIPTLETHWRKLSEIFGVSVDYLLFGKGSLQEKTEDEFLKYHKIIWTSNIEKVPRIDQDDFIPVPLVSGRIAAGAAVIPEESIEDIALIHVSQIGRKRNLVAVRIVEPKGNGDDQTGKSMLPIFGPGDIVAIDRNEKEVRRGKIYAVKIKISPEAMGSTLKFIEQPSQDSLILRPKNEVFPVEIVDLKENPDPIIGRVIWAWRSFI